LRRAPRRGNVDFASPCATVDSIGAGGNKAFGCEATGRFVFIQNAPNEYLTLCEVKVFGTVRPGCPKISTDGRCGPLFGDSVCSTEYRDYAKYCNEDNGWCGDTDSHANAQPSTKYDESSIPASCKGGPVRWQRAASSQCYVHEKGYHNDRLDNPIFNGGGFIGTMSRIQCQQECLTRTDPRGRSCVAIEMSTHSTDPNTVARCALAWGCDFTTHWGGGDVYMMLEFEGYHLAPKGAEKCDYGKPVSQDDCDAAVAVVAKKHGKTPARSLQVLPYPLPACTSSGWSKVPVGCSTQSEGDWSAHFKPAGNAVCNSSMYQLICTNDAEVEILEREPDMLVAPAL